MIHKFDTDIAIKFGVVEAIVFDYFVYWILKNQNDNRLDAYQDGKWWTFGTLQTINENFPYLSTMQLRTAIKNLINKGALIKGNYNKRGFDHTMWYTFGNAINADLLNLTNRIVKNNKSNCQNEQIEMLEITNGFVNFNNAIQTTKESTKEPTKETTKESNARAFNPIAVFEQTFLFMNRDIAERLADLERVCEMEAIEKAFKRAIDRKVSAWGAIGYIEKVAKAIASGDDFAERVSKNKNDVVAAAEKAQRQMDAEGGADDDNNCAECGNTIWGIWGG